MAKQEPASIRYKNPGAMWGNALAVKWGASPNAVTLKDGKGQGNNIAVFPSYVQGICAQLDLWRTSKNYRNKRFADAIAVWSGHNSVQSYINFVTKRVPGLTKDTILNDDFWQSESGIAFLKAQAWHEAGKQYPAPDEDWLTAQHIVLNTSATRTDTASKTIVTARTVGGSVATLAALGNGVSAVTGSMQNTIDQVTVVKDQAGTIIDASKQVVQVVHEGFFAHALAFVRSPTFLAIALVVVLAAWFLTWYMRRREAAAAVPKV